MDIQEKESKFSIITMVLLFAMTVTAGVAYYSKHSKDQSAEEAFSASQQSNNPKNADANRLASLENTIAELGLNQSKLSGKDRQMESSNAALEQRIALLQEQIAELTKNIKTARQNQESESVAAGNYPELPLAIIPMEQIFKQEEQKALLRDQLIATSHTAEAYDDVWASAVTAKIQSNFTNPDMPQIRLTNTDCRTTMCLVEFEAPLNLGNEGEYDPMYENELISGLGEDFPSGTIKTIAMGENMAYTLYLAKAGHTLPGLEDENPVQ